MTDNTEIQGTDPAPAPHCSQPDRHGRNSPPEKSHAPYASGKTKGRTESRGHKL